MSDTVLDERLFTDFCRHLSASVNVVDLLCKLRQLGSPQFDSNKDDPILLAVRVPSMIPRLVQFEYPQFLQACIANMRLLKSCADVFLSEIETDSVEFFESIFEHVTPQVRVEVAENGFIIHAPGILADLIICPIGRVHQEILHSLDQFTKMLAAVDNNPASLFLNAKSPTPESQYIQMWVASQLNIPLKRPAGPILVV